MTKWKVKKIRNWWVVFTHHGNPSAWRTTHTAAITEAQKLARRVVIELPGIPRHTSRIRLPAHNGTPDGHPCGYALIPQDEEHYCAITISGPWGKCGIYEAQDIKPLALALLAHHYKENQ